MLFSLVIIVKGRVQQLRNVLESVSRSSLLPHDIQIVTMDDTDNYAFTNSLELPIELHAMSSSETLPLAAARNAGAKAAKTDILFFLDVDCIVHPNLFKDMIETMKGKTVLSAYPMYLPYLPEHGVYETLLSDAVKHPDRASIPAGHAVSYKKFWSLIFCIQKSAFNKIGGFDESFTGYGGEDTDFAHSFDAHGYILEYVNTHVLHQWHKKYSPPVNYLDDILVNAKQYFKKWNVYPMYAWLQEFEKMGLISLHNNQIIKLRDPTEAEISASESNDPY